MKYFLKRNLRILLLLAFIFSCSTGLFAHGVDDATQSFLTGNKGVAFGPFLYIGAKHMITGYDHILFLVGVIFFLYKRTEILIYISFFTLGHSATLLFGVLSEIHMNVYLIDAIIAGSIIYKGFDNLGGFKQLFGKQPQNLPF